MFHGAKSAPIRRGGSTTAKAAEPFDPAAYAALIAISAAEKRLRASHKRDASSSTARPSSVHRTSNYGPSPSPHAVELTSPPAARDSRRVEEIVARYRPPTRPAAPPDAVGPSYTLLQQLALESESNSSVASDVTEPAGAATAAAEQEEENVTPVEMSAERDSSTSTLPRSRSPPASPPFSDVRGPLPPPSSNTRTAAATARSVADIVNELEDDEDDDAAVSLRDASPLREQSVAGTAGISYRVSTAEAVHTVAQQLNFALYQ
ncbi:hypothetical protein ABB37_00175 [Leptomonas pyrrhocoris]|uniref:Uncharacterized protein n=1 Tax=Leptomonas pyrrhocoris TaxID=157538 RepID=A0A0N0DZZ3_LEPPY|nr:hypothetical protein ABB37_00175 [Leptomonas pyrrhocoris]KPA85845.1 hypothetical protein ABB37_00175 [Leptomonas pyrrhocoris]|eukprot:XP_015664284.1 hypothetical protein ABB37_00175 [Leptomonas pyrrhocoris]